jgi:hypothetical protein
MPPFSKAMELGCVSTSNLPQDNVLPGQPSIALGDITQLKDFLVTNMCSADLETMAPHLWIMTTLSSGNINALHKQRVKGREIVVTEEPRLHLVWIHNRIFIKPVPRYLMSHAFWGAYLDPVSGPLGEEQVRIYKAALGFLRTYCYLVRHETDFKLAQQDHLGLIPQDVDWASFCQFTAELRTSIVEDSHVSRRYCYGELRLTRLNFYAPFLLHRFYFEQVHGQYSDFFAQLYGPILFVFALLSTILSSMQVVLAAEQLVAAQWSSVWYICRWFSVLSLIGTTIIAGVFLSLWLWIFVDEWAYTLKRKHERRRKDLSSSRC